MHKRPNIGVAVIIKKDHKILLGKRKNAHGTGTWAPPGGHLEFYESIEACASREILEETGMQTSDHKLLAVTNNIFNEEDKHYITIFVQAQNHSGAPQAMEPDKCEQWKWFDLDNLPTPLFAPMKDFIQKYKISHSTLAHKPTIYENNI